MRIFTVNSLIGIVHTAKDTVKWSRVKIPINLSRKKDFILFYYFSLLWLRHCHKEFKHFYLHSSLNILPNKSVYSHIMLNLIGPKQRKTLKLPANKLFSWVLREFPGGVITFWSEKQSIDTLIINWISWVLWRNMQFIFLHKLPFRKINVYIPSQNSWYCLYNLFFLVLANDQFCLSVLKKN